MPIVLVLQHGGNVPRVCLPKRGVDTCSPEPRLSGNSCTDLLKVIFGRHAPSLRPLHRPTDNVSPQSRPGIDFGGCDITVLVDRHQVPNCIFWEVSHPPEWLNSLLLRIAKGIFRVLGCLSWLQQDIAVVLARVISFILRRSSNPHSLTSYRCMKHSVQSRKLQSVNLIPRIPSNKFLSSFPASKSKSKIYFCGRYVGEP